MLTCSPGECRDWETFNEISSPLPLVRTQGMQDSCGSLVVLGIPDALAGECLTFTGESRSVLTLLGIPEASSMVQGGHEVTRCLLQPGAQGLSKEGMIAIALSLAIQGLDK